MHSTLKTVARAVVVLAVLAFGTSVANAQIARTITLDCNNLGSTTATITSWTWLLTDGTPDPGNTVFATPVGLSCASNDSISAPVTQPFFGSNGGFVGGVTYTVTFNGTSNFVDAPPLTDGFVKAGKGVHFRDKVPDPNGGKNAAVVVRLGN